MAAATHRSLALRKNKANRLSGPVVPRLEWCQAFAEPGAGKPHVRVRGGFVRGRRVTGFFATRDTVGVMRRHTGNANSPIWLIADSEPSAWRAQLTDPLDERHPSRHNIWTPVAHHLNAELYRQTGKILDDSKLYVRNAVGPPEHKPKASAKQWGKHAKQSQSQLGLALEAHKPQIVITFGGFAFEFTRRAMGVANHYSTRYWTMKRLGETFHAAAGIFDADGMNLFPLLHASIARRYFLDAHKVYSQKERGNYFRTVSTTLARKIAALSADAPIWVDRMHGVKNPKQS